MALPHPSTQKHRLRLSMLLLLIIGLCSIGSPESLKNAHLHHRSPASSSRTSRHLNRSRANGSSRTSSDAEIEPEVAASSIAAPPDLLQPLAVLVSNALGASALTACNTCIAQSSPRFASRILDGPKRGRAPPVA